MLCRWFLLSLAIANLAAQTGAREIGCPTTANTGCVLVAQAVPPAIAASQGAISSDKASVEGQVLNQRTDAPLAGAQVKLDSPDGPHVSAATDRKGRFPFSGLEAGQYRVEAERTGFVPLAWNKMVLTLAAGEQLKDIAVRLTPQAVVSGVVLDADGVPMANVSVAVRRSSRGSKRAMESAGAAQSNDAGEFRIGGLAAGDYLLSAHPRDLALPPAEDKVKRVYVTTWYPGVADAGSAAALHLASGDERTGIVVTLRTSTVVQVRGRVVRPSAKSGLNLAVVELMSSEAGNMDIGGMAQANGPEGAFVIPDVPPGSYRIQAQLIDLAAGQQAFQNMTGASQTIQVGDTDVEGITLSPAPTQSLAGLLKWDGKPPQDAGPCFVSLHNDSPVQMANAGNQAVTSKADGTFSLVAVPSERFDLDVHCEGKGFYLKSARLGDVDVLEKGLDGTEALPSGPLQVTMSTGAGDIEGSVIDKDQHPVTGATVVVVPEASNRAALFDTVTTDQNGRFKLSDIVPGAYLLYAWDQLEEEAWRDEDFMKKYADRGEHVHLDPAGRATVQLHCLKVE